MDKEVIIHVGAPKAASTYLQIEVFPYLKNILYFHPMKNQCQKKEELRPLLILDEILTRFFIFDEEKKDLGNINELRQNLYDDMAAVAEPKILITQETYFRKKPDSVALYKELFPQAKIFLIVREQTDWIESRIRQSTKSGKSYSNEQLLKNIAFSCNWLEIYMDYVNAFGKENVLILPLEKLKESPKEFLDNFYSFTGIERFYPEKTKIHNKGYSKVTNFITRNLNKFLGRKTRTVIKNIMENHLDKHLSRFGNDIIHEKYKTLIKLYYENSNTELSKITGIDFAKYGYAVNPAASVDKTEQIFEKIRNTDFQKHLDQIAKKHENKQIVVYGTGIFFDFVANNYDLSKLNIVAVSDRKFQESKDEFCLGYKAISPSEIPEYKPDVILSGIYNPNIAYKVLGFLKNKFKEKTFIWEELWKYDEI